VNVDRRQPLKAIVVSLILFLERGKKGMEDWRQVALRIFPELQPEVEGAENPMSLWLEIVLQFDTAYDTPRNEDFIRRVYESADWCLKQEGGKDARETFTYVSHLLLGAHSYM